MKGWRFSTIDQIKLAGRAQAYVTKFIYYAKNKATFSEHYFYHGINTTHVYVIGKLSKSVFHVYKSMLDIKGDNNF